MKLDNVKTMCNNFQETVAKGILLKVMKMNKAEWFSTAIGCISSVFNGASLPVYGIVFGGLMGVSMSNS